MNKTLKQIRVNTLQYSEKDMALKLGMPLSEYKKIENRPLEMSVLMKLAQSVGKSIDDLLNMQKQEVKFEIDNAWKPVDELKDKLNDFLKQTQSQEDGDSEFVELLNSVGKIARKPRIAFVGKSDVGKSTLINRLIGSKTLPEAWTPTTSIIVYVKHISDRPSYCHNNVLVFKSNVNGDIWDDIRLQEEEYTKSFCIAEGDYSILHDYGARQGSKYKEGATSAVVFVESDILNNCDLLDLPGYGTKDREEDDSLLKKVQNVDVLIYMSVANGFMRGDDINWLQGELPNLAPIAMNNNSLKPLSNLYIVASQAHTVSNGSMDALRTILSKGAERFELTLSPNYWDNISQSATKKDFEKRFFTYSADQESLRKDFEDDLRGLLNELPGIINKSVIDLIKTQANESIEEIDSRLKTFHEIISQREEKKEDLRKIEENEPERIYKNEAEKVRIIKKIEELSNRASQEIVSGYNKILTIDNIVSIIETNNWRKKEDDMKQLSAKLSNLLNDSYSANIKKYSEEIVKEIESFLHTFENSITIKNTDGSIVCRPSFNYKASFASGLVGLATYGALAAWAASLGNLGAYILVAKGVSILAAMGISVGGTAAASAVIAAIGGPVVLIIGAAVILASLAFALFSGEWKKSLAKKIIQNYEEKKVLNSFIEQNKKYWEDTQKAFYMGAEKLENDYKQFLNDMKNEVDKIDDQELESKMAILTSKRKIYVTLVNNL